MDKYIVCSKCDRKLPADSDFCQYCGAPIEQSESLVNACSPNPQTVSASNQVVSNCASSNKQYEPQKTQSKRFWKKETVVGVVLLGTVFILTLLLGVFTFASETVEKYISSDNSERCYVLANGSNFHRYQSCGLISGEDAIKTTIGRAKAQGYSICPRCFWSSTAKKPVLEINWGLAITVSLLAAAHSGATYITLLNVGKNKNKKSKKKLIVKETADNTSELYSILQRDAELREMLFVFLSLTPENKTLVKDLIKKMK